jgi:hypothetical protein
MEYRSPVFFILALCVFVSAGSAGCLSGAFGPGPSLPPPATVTPFQTTGPGTAIADLALQVSDLPSGFILRDRSAVGYSGISQLDRGLGWQQGYQVSFYHLDRSHGDMTDISQMISTYDPGHINLVYRLRHDALLPAGNNASSYQIPFPIIGDQSAAWRETTGSLPGDITSYNVIFVKNNVFEQITMDGTATDYEMLKTLAQEAAVRIQ